MLAILAIKINVQGQSIPNLWGNARVLRPIAKEFFGFVLRTCQAGCFTRSIASALSSNLPKWHIEQWYASINDSLPGFVGFAGARKIYDKAPNFVVYQARAVCTASVLRYGQPTQCGLTGSLSVINAYFALVSTTRAILRAWLFVADATDTILIASWQITSVDAPSLHSALAGLALSLCVVPASPLSTCSAGTLSLAQLLAGLKLANSVVLIRAHNSWVCFAGLSLLLSESNCYKCFCVFTVKNSPATFAGLFFGQR